MSAFRNFPVRLAEFIFTAAKTPHLKTGSPFFRGKALRGYLGRCTLHCGKEDLSMSERGAGKKKQESKQSRQDLGDVELEQAGEALVVPSEFLSTPPKSKKIHPRRVLPPVPEAPKD
jgi:hypothetical protein